MSPVPLSLMSVANYHCSLMRLFQVSHMSLRGFIYFMSSVFFCELVQRSRPPGHGPLPDHESVDSGVKFMVFSV